MKILKWVAVGILIALCYTITYIMFGTIYGFLIPWFVKAMWVIGIITLIVALIIVWDLLKKR
jgi:ABC-type multidrug transport system permease subunit